MVSDSAEETQKVKVSTLKLMGGVLGGAEVLLLTMSNHANELAQEVRDEATIFAKDIFELNKAVFAR